MADKPADASTVWWAKKFDDIDREVARLATMCNVRILDAGAIERVLHNDASICGTPNPRAFEKLRAMLMMHYSVRDDALAALGTEKTKLLVDKIVAELRERFEERLGGTG